VPGFAVPGLRFTIPGFTVTFSDYIFRLPITVAGPNKKEIPMKRKLFLALAMMATMTLGTIVYESASFAQNSNSSTTATNTNSNSSMSGSHRRRRHRRMRRARRSTKTAPKNTNQ
jgi:hypothetical protein